MESPASKDVGRSGTRHRMEANENTSETVQEAAQYLLKDKATGRFFDGEMFYGEAADAVPLTEPEVDCLLYDFQREFIELIAA